MDRRGTGKPAGPPSPPRTFPRGLATQGRNGRLAVPFVHLPPEKHPPLRIASLACATPSMRIDNDTFLSLLDERVTADGMPAEARAEVAERVRDIFDRAGTRERFMLYPPEPGYAAGLLRRAATEALAKAGRDAADIDLIVYCSVARGWMEPSTAAAAQALIGAHNASCFDVLEACAGWMRAVEVADALLRAGRYRNALVLGVEAGMQDTLMPRGGDTEVASEHLAGFTLGEAATAMLIEPDGSPAPEIVIRSDGELYDVCMIPLPGIAAFLPGDAATLPESGRFLSHADRLFTRVITSLVGVMRPRLDGDAMKDIDLFILHAASSRAGEVVRRALDIPEEKWLCPHDVFGNTVSMSMPVALDHALKTGRVKHGDKVCFLVGSAGISYGYGILTV